MGSPMRYDDIPAEARAFYPFDGTDTDVILALRMAYVAGAHRTARPHFPSRNGADGK
jgi:hypothetical protein